ncbi:TRAP transporter large permease [Breznakiella homolactica]|uniref:TRAP transporter large permease n=1 Tax=Breznakiella homolactica TaxID=2798577 RepID=A0A7T7XQR7_9SPIR|nr:TRAP transporter large permease [Breznakiella homolactica]
MAHVVLAAATSGILMKGGDGTIIAQQLVLGANSYILLAVPFFIVSGDIAAKGNTSEKIVNAINAFLGRVRGGLGIATIFACAVFGAITGSAMACVVAIGALMLPKLLERGYPRLLVIGILTCAGTLGVMIPPSIPMLQIAIAMRTSVGAQFTAGFIPGLLTAALMSIYVYFVAKKMNLPIEEKVPFRQKMKILKDSFWALMFPVIILGGIYSGLTTPTEAAVVSVFYVIFVELVIYRTIKVKDLYRIIGASVVNAATLTLTIATAQVFVWLLTTEKVPLMLYEAITATITNRYVLLFALCGLFFIVGCFTNVATVVIILGPMLLPVLQYFEINLIQFGILAVMMAQIGFITPPFGLCLFVSMKMAKSSMGEVIRGSYPFIIAMFAATLLLLFIPQLSTFLPDLIFK